MTTPLASPPLQGKDKHSAPPEWRVSPGLTPYATALAAMEARVDAIIAGTAPELLWLLEHPPLYTGGTSADPAELINLQQFPVFETGRGGRYTYHGPGQRVVYALCDLRLRGQDLRAHIWRLEEWIIRTLAEFGVTGERRAGRVGIWVAQDSVEEKIAAIGVRVRKWVTYHGLAINVHPNLDHFNGIVPCGLPEFGVTSLHKLGVTVTLDELDTALATNWPSIAKMVTA
jgi:lipoyl(octanoyl) transferase